MLREELASGSGDSNIRPEPFRLTHENLPIDFEPSESEPNTKGYFYIAHPHGLYHKIEIETEMNEAGHLIIKGYRSLGAFTRDKDGEYQEVTADTLESEKEKTLFDQLNGNISEEFTELGDYKKYYNFAEGSFVESTDSSRDYDRDSQSRIWLQKEHINVQHKNDPDRLISLTPTGSVTQHARANNELWNITFQIRYSKNKLRFYNHSGLSHARFKSRKTLMKGQLLEPNDMTLKQLTSYNTHSPLSYITYEDATFTKEKLPDITDSKVSGIKFKLDNNNVSLTNASLKSYLDDNNDKPFVTLTYNTNARQGQICIWSDGRIVQGVVNQEIVDKLIKALDRALESHERHATLIPSMKNSLKEYAMFEGKPEYEASEYAAKMVAYHVNDDLQGRIVMLKNILKVLKHHFLEQDNRWFRGRGLNATRLKRRIQNMKLELAVLKNESLEVEQLEEVESNKLEELKRKPDRTEEEEVEFADLEHKSRLARVLFSTLINKALYEPKSTPSLVILKQICDQFKVRAEGQDAEKIPTDLAIALIRPDVLEAYPQILDQICDQFKVGEQCQDAEIKKAFDRQGITGEMIVSAKADRDAVATWAIDVTAHPEITARLPTIPEDDTDHSSTRNSVTHPVSVGCHYHC